jgi:hypothetical protein
VEFPLHAEESARRPATEMRLEGGIIAVCNLMHFRTLCSILSHSCSR